MSKFNVSAKPWEPSAAPAAAAPADSVASAYGGGGVGYGAAPGADAAPDMAAMLQMLSSMGMGDGSMQPMAPMPDMLAGLADPAVSQLLAALGGGAAGGAVGGGEYDAYAGGEGGEEGDFTAEDEANLLAWEQEQVLQELENTLDGMGVVEDAERQQLILSYFGEGSGPAGEAAPTYADEAEEYDDESGVVWTPEIMQSMQTRGGLDMASDGGGWGSLLYGEAPAPAAAPAPAPKSLSVHAVEFVPSFAAPAPAPVRAPAPAPARGGWGKPAPAPAPAPAKAPGSVITWADL